MQHRSVRMCLSPRYRFFFPGVSAFVCMLRVCMCVLQLICLNLPLSDVIPQSKRLRSLLHSCKLWSTSLCLANRAPGSVTGVQILIHQALFKQTAALTKTPVHQPKRIKTRCSGNRPRDAVYPGSTPANEWIHSEPQDILWYCSPVFFLLAQSEEYSTFMFFWRENNIKVFQMNVLINLLYYIIYYYLILLTIMLN